MNILIDYFFLQFYSFTLKTRERAENQRQTQEDLEELEMEWEQMEERAQDRTAWRMFVSSALCYNRSDGH